MASNKELALKILELVGGKGNVASATNCMTRLRLRLIDSTKVDISTLKATEGVLGVVEAETLQVIVGPGKAKKVADVFAEDLGVPRDSVVTEDWKDNKASIKQKQKQGPLKAALETIAGIFIPLIPAIIAAGIFNGFGNLIGTLIGQEVISGDVWNFIRLIFLLIGSSFLAYLAIFTGVNAAKRFGATEALGGMIGAMTIGPQINQISQLLGLFNSEVPLNSILTTGKGGIIGVIFGVLCINI